MGHRQQRGRDFLSIVIAVRDGRARLAEDIAAALTTTWDVAAAEADRALAAAAARARDDGWRPDELVHAVGRKLPAPDRRLLTTIAATDTDGTSEGQLLAPWAKLERLDRIDALLRAAQLHLALACLPPMTDAIPLLGDGDGAGAAPSGVDPRLLDRVHALLAKAESTEFEAEAEAFTAKAQELMSRHAIDDALLEARHRREGSAGAAGGVVSTRVLIHDPYAKGKTALLAGVANANRCKAVWLKAHGLSMLVGLPSDVTLTTVLYASLVTQCSAAMQRASRKVDDPRSFREGFVLAFAVRIGERLREANDAVTEEAARADADGELLPVLAARRDEIDRAVDRAFGRLRRVRSTTVDARGWAAGRAAADTATIAAAPALEDR